MSRFKIIHCPLCKGKIEVDLNTGQVYRHFEKVKGKEAVEAFDRFVDKVAEKAGSAEEIFKHATEMAKEKDLEALFDEAAKKAKDEIGEE